jgi:hypothetical protein
MSVWTVESALAATGFFTVGECVLERATLRATLCAPASAACVCVHAG